MNEESKIKFPVNSFYKGTPIMVYGNFIDTPKEELKEGGIYIYDGYTWRYTEKLPEKATKYPLISYDECGDIVTKDSIFNELVPVDSVVNHRLNIICERTVENMNFTKDTEFTPTASSTSVFIPEIKETDEAYQVVLQDLEEIEDDAKAVIEQLGETQREVLSDYDERKHIVEREKGRCLYLAGVKDGVRLAKYLDISE